MAFKTKIPIQEVVSEIACHPAYEQNLLYAQDTRTFYMFDGRYFEVIEDEAMDVSIYTYLVENHGDLQITTNFTKDVVNQLRWKCYRRTESIETSHIALSDCLLDTNDFTFHEYDRDKVAIHLIDVSRADIEKGDCPLFKKFLEQILVTPDHKTDYELITVLQEFFGYFLMNTLEAQVMLFMVGEGANGKSVLLKLLTAMIGQANCTSKSIETLTTNKFSTGDLVGKKLNVCNEEESKFLRSDKFKALVSGDLIDVEQKYKPSFAFIPKVKYVFATNELPSFDGVNLGLRRRVKIIPFYKSFSEGEQDRKLVGKLMAELPGIMAWAIEGGKRLIGNDFKLSSSLSVDEMADEFMKGNSTAVRFFSEFYEPCKSEYVSHKVPYKEYQTWCLETGRKHSGETKFYSDIKMAFGTEKKRGRDENGKLITLWNFRRQVDNQLDVDMEMIQESQLRDSQGDLL